MTTDEIKLVCDTEDLVTLTVVIQGADDAEMEVIGGGITCSSDSQTNCSSRITRETSVELQLLNSDPDEARFVEWQGCDATRSEAEIEFCELAMSSDRTITAVMEPLL